MDLSKEQESWVKHWTTLISNQQAVTGSPGTMSLFSSQDHLGIEHPISLLPLSMKIASRSLGTDLVAVQPLPGPTGLLQFVDFDFETRQDHLGIEHDR